MLRIECELRRGRFAPFPTGKADLKRHPQKAGPPGRRERSMQNRGRFILAAKRIQNAGLRDVAPESQTRVLAVRQEFVGRGNVENGLFFGDQTGSSGSGEILFYDFATRNIRRVSQLDKPFAVTDSAFAVSPDRRYILYTQVDQSGSDIYILDRSR